MMPKLVIQVEISQVSVILEPIDFASRPNPIHQRAESILPRITWVTEGRAIKNPISKTTH